MFERVFCIHAVEIDHKNDWQFKYSYNALPKCPAHEAVSAHSGISNTVQENAKERKSLNYRITALNALKLSK